MNVKYIILSNANRESKFEFRIYVTLVFLHQLKEVVTEKTSKFSGEEPTEVAEPEDAGLALKTLSITADAEQKCVEAIVRLNSINVELIGDELEFIRYVMDFAIDYATNNIVDASKAGYLRIQLAHMLNVDENDEQFIAAIETIDKLIGGAVGEGEEETDFEENDREEAGKAPSPAKSESPSDEQIVADEFFYHPTDPSRAHIPPVWTPSNKRANAALIYLYFRIVCSSQPLEIRLIPLFTQFSLFNFSSLNIFCPLIQCQILHMY